MRQGGEEIFGHRTGRQRRIRVQRLEVRAAQRVALVDADVERPVLFPLEALRETEVRKRARAEFGGLRVDARLDLRAFPRARADADTRRVRFDLAALGVLVLREQRGVIAQAVVETEDSESRRSQLSRCHSHRLGVLPQARACRAVPCSAVSSRHP